jgi:hypothetical protein
MGGKFFYEKADLLQIEFGNGKMISINVLSEKTLELQVLAESKNNLLQDRFKIASAGDQRCKDFSGGPAPSRNRLSCFTAQVQSFRQVLESVLFSKYDRVKCSSLLASCGSAVVELSTHNPKVMDSNLATW